MDPLKVWLGLGLASVFLLIGLKGVWQGEFVAVGVGQYDVCRRSERPLRYWFTAFLYIGVGGFVVYRCIRHLLDPSLPPLID